MSKEATYYLNKLTQKYRAIKFIEALLLALAVAAITFGVLSFLNISTPLEVGFSSIALILFFTFRLYQGKVFRIKGADIVTFINSRYPDLQESADLLLKNDDELSLIQRLQYARTEEKLKAIQSSIDLPNRIVQHTIALLICTCLMFAMIAFRSKDVIKPSTKATSSMAITSEKKVPVSISDITISITPPQYTGAKKTETTKPELNLPEGSTVEWSLQFTSNVAKASLIFPNKDTLQLKSVNNKLIAQRKFTLPTFYQITWSEGNNTQTSDYYKIEITSDRPPQVTVNNLQQFTALTINDQLKIPLSANLRDDYGMKDAYIIATVSKGSGESVKFREEKLKFTEPDKIHGTNLQAKRSIDILKLGLEPGDELYFYVEALDNKTPVPNKTRTETFFIALQDTTSEASSVEAGLGVDLMPEYFRSQRQIIIDTEKLIKNKKRIALQEFKRTSNELGYDQKVLRLKYGEFLGEEFESGIGPGSEAVDTEEHHEEGEKEDPTKAYGHVHDTENEHNLVQEKKHDDHEHQHEDGKQEDPTAAYAHVHDDPEEATFFTQSIRAKLKAALTVMWDAELHLRLFEPEKSLPYQYKALKLLKEISNDSRIYVHKTGFDPPPIKEEKRLSGDLSEIKNTKANNNEIKSETYPAISKAIILTENILALKKNSLTSEEKNSLVAAGQELSKLALQKPGQFLRALSLIKSFNNDEVKRSDFTLSLSELQSYLWKAFPENMNKPSSNNRSLHALDESFIQKLEPIKNE